MGTNTIFNKSTAISPDKRFCRLIQVGSDVFSNFQVRGPQSVGTQVNVKDKRGYVWILLLLLLVLLLACVITGAAVLLLRSHDCDTSHAFQGTTTTVSAHFAASANYTDLRTTESYVERQTTSATISAQNITIESNVEVQTTSTPISAQNITIGSRGRAFVVLFTRNDYNTTKSIYVTSEKGVQINMSTSPFLDSRLRSQIDKSIDIPSNKKMLITSGIELTSFTNEFKSIQIETSEDAFVISHDRFTNKYSVGCTAHIPFHKLSTRYVVVSSEPVSSQKSQIAMAAINDNTLISIKFKMKRNIPLNIHGKTMYNNDVFNITLNNYETYQIEHDTDLTGTVLESSYPIAAFSGNDCNKVGSKGYCDHLIEQLPPTISADDTYIVPPNSPDRDTLIRITAIENVFLKYTKRRISHIMHLNTSEYYDVRIASNETCVIESASPLMVTSFGLHASHSNLGDPSMTMVPGIHQYLDYYKIVVSLGYTYNYVSIMIVDFSKNVVRINGFQIRQSDIFFEKTVQVRNTAYNVRSVRVTEGELTASTVDGERFGLLFAGVKKDEAYGFSGNSLLP